MIAVTGTAFEALLWVHKSNLDPPGDTFAGWGRGLPDFATGVTFGGVGIVLLLALPNVVIGALNGLPSNAKNMFRMLLRVAFVVSIICSIVGTWYARDALVTLFQ